MKINKININKSIVGPISFIVFSIMFFYTVISNTPKVLILHSYNVEYIWSALLDKSLKEALKKRKNIRTYFYYMNSKFIYNKGTELSAIKAIKQYDPDLILALDDNAQFFLSKHYLSSGIKIVFAGVNGGVEKYNYIGNENITGVFERKPIAGILFVLSELNKYYKTPNNTNVTLVVDGSNSSKKDYEYLKKKDWKNFSFSANSINTFNEFKEFILSLKDKEKRVDYILMSGYRKFIAGHEDGKKIYTNYKSVVDWTKKNSPVPIIALNVFGAQDGFPIAVGSSSYEQIGVALSMIDKIFNNNVKPGDIPFIYPELYSISINKTSLRQLRSGVPDVIESFAAAAYNIYE